MGKKWLKVSIVFCIAVLILLMSGMIIGIVMGGKIKDLAVKELNKRLATEVSVNGDIRFSVLSNFPYASITFNKVQIKETLPEKSDLLSCEKISLLFNIWDVLGSHYSMKKVIMQNGDLSVRVNSEGKNNYSIFKTPEAGSGKDFSLKIENANLSNVVIHYDDDRSNQHYVFNTASSLLSGDFSSDNFLLSINSDLICKQLLSSGIDYLPNRKVDVDCELMLDLGKNSYSVKDGNVNIEGNQFLVSGNITSLVGGNQVDLKISGNNLRIEEIAALLPPQYANYFSHFKSQGNFQFNGEINGLISAGSNPSVNFQFSLKNGTLSNDQMKESFEHINLSGVFSNGSSNNLASSFVELKNFSTTFDGNPVNGTLSMRNFSQPFLDMNLNGEISLQKIAPLFPSNYITKLDGTITFQRFYFRGNTSQLSRTADLNKMEAGGNFILKNVSIGTDKTLYDHLNGTFDINNNQIGINELSFRAKGSDLRIIGDITNFIPYLLASMKDSTTFHQKIGMNINLSSNNLKWEDLVGTQSSSSAKNPDSYYSIPSLFYVLTGSVSGNIEKFSYEKFNCSAFHGNILFLGNNIYFNNFGMNAEHGNVTANGKLDITNVKRNRLEMSGKLDHLDITQLFDEFNNFGQTTLTQKNLKGSVTSEFALQATWDEKQFNKSKLYAVADVVVENGELNNFEPMMALAKFVKLSELRNIRFSKLQNQIEIRNQKIYIPTTQIFSNALNVQLSGTHSFDNIIDYQVQLNLLKLLTSKFEKTSFTPDASDESTEGFLNLYLTMTGPAADPVIKYDKKAVKQKIASDLKKEKNELKEAMEKEFNPQHQQQIKDWNQEEGIQYMEFESDSVPAENESEGESTTRQNQKKEFDNFKNIFKPKSPPK